MIRIQPSPTCFGARPEAAVTNSNLARGFWGSATAPNHRRGSAVLFTQNMSEPTLLTVFTRQAPPFRAGKDSAATASVAWVSVPVVFPETESCRRHQFRRILALLREQSRAG